MSDDTVPTMVPDLTRMTVTPADFYEDGPIFILSLDDVDGETPSIRIELSVANWYAMKAKLDYLITPELKPLSG